MVPNPRCLTLIIPLILLLGCADASQDGASLPVCSNRSLQGTYLYQIIGRDAVPEGQVTAGPYAEAGMDLYDGNGQVTTTYSSSREQGTQIIGHYDIQADCSGQIVYPGTEGPLRRYQVYIDPAGSRLTFIDVTDTSRGYLLGGEKLRVAAQTAPLANCSTQTLSGTFTYSVEGAVTTEQGLKLFREAGMESYDGAGNIANRYTDNQGVTATIAGQYVIRPNCQGTATYASGGRYELYVDPLGQWFAFIDLTAGAQRGGKNHLISRQRLVEGAQVVPVDTFNFTGQRTGGTSAPR